MKMIILILLMVMEMLKKITTKISITIATVIKAPKTCNRTPLSANNPFKILKPNYLCKNNKQSQQAMVQRKEPWGRYLTSRWESRARMMLTSMTSTYSWRINMPLEIWIYQRMKLRKVKINLILLRLLFCSSLLPSQLLSVVT